MSKRLRLVSVLVQPQFMVDDGDSLEPLTVQPITVPASEWGNVLALVAAGVEQLREQVEGPPLAVVEDEAVAE